MRAAYDSIYYDIRDAIRNGEYHYKDFLPSEGVLTDKYGCAHNTVRKALFLLASQGYVQAIHGKGVRVIYQSTPYLTDGVKPFEPNGFDSFQHEDSAEGCSISVLSNEVVLVEDDIARLYGFELGSELVSIERTRALDGRIIEWEKCYLRRDTVGDPKASDVERPLSALISSSGEKLVTSKMEITVEAASPRDIEILDDPDLSIVVVIRQAFFDHDGLLCEISEIRRIAEAFAMLRTTIRSKID